MISESFTVEYTSADKDNDSVYKWRLLLGTISTDTLSGCKKVKSHWTLIGCSLSVNLSCFFLSHYNVDIDIFWISEGIKRNTLFACQWYYTYAGMASR